MPVLQPLAVCVIKPFQDAICVISIKINDRQRKEGMMWQSQPIWPAVKTSDSGQDCSWHKVSR